MDGRSDSPAGFDSLMAKARAWTKRLIDVYAIFTLRVIRTSLPLLITSIRRYTWRGRVPRMNHQELFDRKQQSTDPAGRSALQNFERLMRHVALWEHACLCRGEVE